MTHSPRPQDSDIQCFLCTDWLETEAEQQRGAHNACLQTEYNAYHSEIPCPECRDIQGHLPNCTYTVSRNIANPKSPF